MRIGIGKKIPKVRNVSKLNHFRPSAFIPTGAITTKDGNLIVLTSDYNFVLTVDGFKPLDLLMSGGVQVTTNDNKLISK